MSLLKTAALSVCRKTPRGGFWALRKWATWDKELQNYPITLKLLPHKKLYADLRLNVWFPLFKYGYYPHQYGEDLMALSIIREGDIIWDVGANIGYTALIYTKATGISGSVFCFEPGKTNFAELLKTTDSEKNIKALNLAVSSFDGQIEFEEMNSLDTSRVSSHRSDKTSSVPCSKLDSLWSQCEIKAPTFIKIDVEGHEMEVLEGARTTIERNEPIIQFEALTQDDADKTAKLLLEYSKGTYTFYSILQTGELTAWQPQSKRKESQNILAVKSKHSDRINILLK